MPVEDDITAVPPRVNAGQLTLHSLIRVMYDIHSHIGFRPIQNRCMCRFPPSRFSVTRDLVPTCSEIRNYMIVRNCQMNTKSSPFTIKGRGAVVPPLLTGQNRSTLAAAEIPTANPCNAGYTPEPNLKTISASGSMEVHSQIQCTGSHLPPALCNIGGCYSSS